MAGEGKGRGRGDRHMVTVGHRHLHESVHTQLPCVYACVKALWL